ncbi:McrB family protein [uncultured Phascolarctobacterium sp.]|uniref:McrB family protein n=1 Tax=uncultured Phascolarctobacterium sp. TaxID=512296 RepID=UPI0025F9DC23|nr:AAA family ATPase [uncultured Phascolarctobacterium sp.]
MEFDAALDTVKKYLHISLDNEYDGIIVKKMAKSNLIGEENSTGNQTHIAITGAQRDAFPYICAAQYLTCPHEDIDDTIKRFFMCQIKVNIYRSNVEPLDKANTIRFGAGQEKKSVYTTVWRRRGRNNEEQVQLSALNLDDSDFVEFRKLIHTADYIVILKLQACLEYDWFIIPKESIADSDDLKALDGKFIHKSTSTIVKIDQNVQMDAVLNNKTKTTKGTLSPSNVLLYGVPGCGKSYKVEDEYESKITNEQCKVRVVFHPDYTYSDFIGQLMPVLKEVENAQGVKENKLQYEFVPGPFTKIIKTAYEEPEQKCLLIIEELNRGNAPAIFGEIFQLLDRKDDGESKYGIYNADIAKYAYGGLPENQGKAIDVIANTPIKLPPNLTIVATMNTSDQNVFTMDTAFQRRWQMEHIPNKFDLNTAHVNKHLPNSEISWGVFAQTVNKKMHDNPSLGFGGTDDKSLGVYFATDNDLDNAKRFAEKVLKYLWDDAFKLGRQALFSNCSEGLSSVIEAYEDAAKAKIEKQNAEDPLKAVLVPEVYNEMQKRMLELTAEQPQAADEEPAEAAEDADADNPDQEPASEE